MRMIAMQQSTAANKYFAFNPKASCRNDVRTATIIRISATEMGGQDMISLHLHIKRMHGIMGYNFGDCCVTPVTRKQTNERNKAKGERAHKPISNPMCPE